MSTEIKTKQELMDLGAVFALSQTKYPCLSQPAEVATLPTGEFFTLRSNGMFINGTDYSYWK